MYHTIPEGLTVHEALGHGVVVENRVFETQRRMVFANAASLAIDTYSYQGPSQTVDTLVGKGKRFFLRTAADMQCLIYGAPLNPPMMTHPLELLLEIDQIHRPNRNNLTLDYLPSYDWQVNMAATLSAEAMKVFQGLGDLEQNKRNVSDKKLQRIDTNAADFITAANNLAWIASQETSNGFFYRRTALVYACACPEVKS